MRNTLLLPILLLGMAGQSLGDVKPNQAHIIISAEQLMPLDVPQRASGVKPRLYPPNLTNAQLWRFENQGTYFFIRSVVSGKVLDMHDLKSGTLVQQYEFNRSPPQRWKINGNQKEFVEIQSVSSNLVLDTGTKAPKVQQFKRNGTRPQKWIIVPRSSVQAVPKEVRDGIGGVLQGKVTEAAAAYRYDHRDDKAHRIRLAGREIGSWTEERGVKAWADRPGETLKITVDRADLYNCGRVVVIYVRTSLTVDIRGELRHKLRNVASVSSKVSARAGVTATVALQCRQSGLKLTVDRVQCLDIGAKIRDLRLANNGLNAIRGLFTSPDLNKLSSELKPKINEKLESVTFEVDLAKELQKLRR